MFVVWPNFIWVSIWVHCEYNWIVECLIYHDNLEDLSCALNFGEVFVYYVTPQPEYVLDFVIKGRNII